MNNKPGTRAKITPKSRNYIIARALAPPRIDRRALAKKLQRELEEKGFDVPEVEVLWRMISKARNHQPSELDRDWTLGSLADHPIPSEALAIVVAFQMYRLTTDEFLTIREALWAGRLYKLFNNKENPFILHGWAFLYALEEVIFETQGKHFDSYALDTEMMHSVFYGHEAYKAFRILEIADKYDADPFKLRDLNLSLEEIEETVKATPEEYAGTWDEAIRSSATKYDGTLQYFEDYNKEVARIMGKLGQLPRSQRKSPAKMGEDKPVKGKKRRKQK